MKWKDIIKHVLLIMKNGTIFVQRFNISTKYYREKERVKKVFVIE